MTVCSEVFIELYIIISFSVEWSCFEDFTPLAGDATVEDTRHLEYEIKELMQGNIYFVRVAAWNMKGYGQNTVSTPSYAVPSSKCESMEGFPLKYLSSYILWARLLKHLHKIYAFTIFYNILKTNFFLITLLFDLQSLSIHKFRGI